MIANKQAWLRKWGIIWVGIVFYSCSTSNYFFIIEFGARKINTMINLPSKAKTLIKLGLV